MNVFKVMMIGLATWAWGCANSQNSATDAGAESDAVDSGETETASESNVETAGDDDAESDVDNDSATEDETDGYADSGGDEDSDSDRDSDRDSDADSTSDSDDDADNDDTYGSTTSDTEAVSGADSDTVLDSDDDADLESTVDTDTTVEALDTGTRPPVDTDTTRGDGSDTQTEQVFECYGSAGTPLENAAIPDGYCAWIFASDLAEPRGIVTNVNGDVLVVARDNEGIILLHDDNGNGVSDSNERVTLAEADGLNHGIALNNGYLYASSATTVYKWSYTDGREPLGDPSTVVSGMPSGGHSARTLIFDNDGFLYVAIGSAGNVDADSSRSRVIRFSPEQLQSETTYNDAEVFADGMRNETALGFDPQGRLWGVENGSDNLNRADLGGDIHTDNPGEELNLMSEPGAFYGYPYCWSEGTLETGMGPNTQWAYDPSSQYTDEWCRDTANVVPPVLSLQAHSAPLGILFYSGGMLPEAVTGDAFIAYHGSWNRRPETGYKVVHLPFDDEGMPTGDVLPFLEYDGDGDTGEGWPYRPVDLAAGRQGKLFITSDAVDASVVITVGYQPATTR